MNKGARNEMGITPLQPSLDTIDSVESKADLAGLMAKIQKQGASLPFGWFVNNDAKNSSEYALYLSQSGLGLPDRDYYLKDDEKFTKIRAAYEQYMTDILAKSGVKNASEAAKSVIAFEKSLADAQWSRVQSRDATKSYNKITVADADKLMGDFDLATFFKDAGVDIQELLCVSQAT